jgi:hypothetical protein
VHFKLSQGMAKLEKRSLSTMMTKEEYLALAEAK